MRIAGTGSVASWVGLFAAGLFVAGVVGSGACASATREFDGAGGEGGDGGDATGGGAGAGGASCPSNLADCGGACVDRTTDPKHCGACDNACGPLEICTEAACVCGPAGTVCGAACVDTLNDPAHCGTCDFPCPAGGPNTTATCQQGVCGSTCADGFSDCNGQIAGCETSTVGDIKNCGGCGIPCSSPGNTEMTCENSMCVTGACLKGFADCDMSPANGCEANLSASSDHCSACDMPCKPGTVCVAGVCGNVDLTGVFSSFASEGRDVHIWKSPMCAVLANYKTFCQDRGLKWWSPKSQLDAQKLLDHASSLDMTHTWIQVYGLATGKGTVGGFPVTVDSPDCVDFSSSEFGAVRKWGCSFCDPEVNANAGGESCCWDKSHTYDWFVCEM
jgi:hypothetical protein